MSQTGEWFTQIPDSSSYMMSTRGKTRRESINPVTTFAGANYPLSNFFEFPFKIWGLKFKSAEAAYRYAKVMVAGNLQLANQIHKADYAGTAKRLSREQPPTAQFIDKKTDIIYYIVRHKFDQCPPFREALKRCKSIIAETVPGQYFW